VHRHGVDAAHGRQRVDRGTIDTHDGSTNPDGLQAG
jgi:hypothetical protein